MRFAVVICALAFFALCNYSYGQSHTHTFFMEGHAMEVSQWRIEDGLPHWLITDFLEDEQGYAWFASAAGLIKFDGIDFTTYSGKKFGFQQKSIDQIAMDPQQKIWTFYNYHDSIFVDIFDPVIERAIPVEEYIGASIPLSHLYYLGIYEQEDKLWLLDPILQHGGYFDDQWHWKLASTIPLKHDSYFKYYYPVNDSVFWEFDQFRNPKKIQRITDDGIPIGSAHYFNFIGDKTIFSLDNEGALWSIFYGKKKNTIDDDFMIYIRDTSVQRVSLQDYHSDEIYTNIGFTRPYFTATKQGYAFVAFDESIALFHDGKILLKDISSLIHSEFDTEQPQIFFPGKNATIWFRSSQGLFRCRFQNKLFKSYKKRAHSPISFRGITLLYEKTVIANTYDGTVAIDLKSGTFTTIDFPLNNMGKGILKQGDNIWISQHYSFFTKLEKSSLNLLQSYKVNPSFPGYDGEAIWVKEDTLLVGSQLGLMRLMPGDSLLRLFALQDTLVNCFHENNRGLWLGTEFGLTLLTKNGGKTKHFSLTGEYGESMVVTDIHEDAIGSFWLATRSGLVNWQPMIDNAPTIYGQSQGLSNEELHGVYEDRLGNLWLPSNYGLMRFDKSSGRVNTYYERDGLPHNEFNKVAHYQSADGQLFLGTVDGLCVFHPDSISATFKSDNLVLDVVRATVYAKETEMPRDASLALRTERTISWSPKENRAIITFTPNYLQQADIIYQWKIPSLGEQWKSLNDNSLELTNLPYGTHLIEIKVLPVGNLIGAKTLQFQIIVFRPFYLRWWFLLSALTLIGGISFAILKWRERRLLLANRRLQEEIQKATSELRSLDKMKSRFFANVSHELRTPLSLILGPLERLLEHQQLKKNQRNQLERIQRNAQQIKNLTEEILDLTRLETGKIDVVHSNIKLEYTLRRWWSSFVSLADYHGIDFQLDLSLPADLLVTIDHLKVERIVNNLISNAFKFCRSEDSVALYARWASHTLLIEVKDAGPGIAEADLSKIFDRYYQANPMQELQGGLGIGLSMSRELARLLDGELTVSSTIGEGSTFSLILPAKKAEINDVSPLTNVLVDKKVSLSKPVETSLSSTYPYILLVEDNDDLRVFIQEQLITFFRVKAVKDGSEALAYLEKTGEVSLIISDVMMPGVDGFKLLQLVRQQEKFKHIPFIILSARAAKEDRLHALRLGVDSYLLKPFESVELIARINNLLANQARRKSLRKNVSTSVPDNFDHESIWLRQLDEILTTSYQNSNLKISELSNAMNTSERTFRNRLKEYTGLGPTQYLQQYRLTMALAMLEQKQWSTVAEVAYNCGFNNPSYFSKCFRDTYGRSPSEYL